MAFIKIVKTKDAIPNVDPKKHIGKKVRVSYGTSKRDSFGKIAKYNWTPVFGGEYVIKLEGIIKICKDCHDKIHGGFSSRLNLKYGFTRQPAPVSDCTDSKKYPWNFAKYLCVDGNLYPLYSV